MNAATLARIAAVLGIAAVPGAAHGVQVSGQLTTEGGRDLIGAAVTIVRKDAPARSTADVARFLPDGRFIFRGVQPGRYVIRARGETEPRGVTLFAIYRVMVAKDITNGPLLVAGPADLRDLRITIADVAPAAALR